MDQEQFQKILDLLVKAIPGNWKKIAFLAKYLTGKSSMEFYTKYQDQFVSCFEDQKVKSNITDKELDEIFKKIDDILKEEQRKNLKDKKPFTSFTMIVDSQGEMKASMDYEDFLKTEPEFDKKWKATYLTESYYRLFEESALEWLFVKPLQSENLLNDFESLYNVTLPDNFKNLIKVANGGAPSKPIIDSDPIKRIQVVNLLSFNRSPVDPEKEEVVYPVIDSFRSENGVSDLVPFASAGFNNFICLDGQNKIVLFQKEQNERFVIAQNLDEFIGKLHE